MKSLLTGLVVLLASTVLVPALGETLRGIRINEPWARSSGERGVSPNIYFDVTNHADTEDEIVSLWTSVADAAVIMEPHWHGMKMTMERVTSLRIGAGETISMHPGGYQVTLVHPKEFLRAGRVIGMEIRFRKAGTIEFTVPMTNRLLPPRSVSDEPKKKLEE